MLNSRDSLKRRGPCGLISFICFIFAGEFAEMNMQRTVLSFLLMLGTLWAVAQGEGQGLVINELMQSNVDCIMDDRTEFPDSWVELYNNSSETITLKGYRLGISDKADEAWQLSGKTIQPKGFLLVYCDRENTGLHTSFRLESGKGCAVYLFKDGDIVDCLPEPLKKMPAPNIAYGRKSDGGNEWGYQLTPTPGKANCGETCAGDQILGEPVFSEKGRVVAGALNLQLTLSVPEESPEGTEIRYTTNGTEPTASSKLYSAPIAIRQTSVIRAKLFCPGWLSPVSSVQSYIRHGRDVTLPVISIATNSSYLDDAKIGIFTNNSNNKRKDWRRPMNIEFFFSPDADSDLNQLCEARVTGGQSRNCDLKSLGIYAHKRFGTSRFDYEFFPDQKPGLTDFKSLMLRNAGNDFDYLYMRDAIIQCTMSRHVDIDWQAWRPAIIYINGVYKGMLNIRERSNENNVYTNYDGLEDIDMIENWSELKEGDKKSFNQFKAFYSEEGHTKAEYEQWMDCGEFMNLMIPNLYYVNLDFPGNNIMMWRPRAEGGRWRWIMKDTDFGLGLYGRDVNYKILDWLYNPNFDKNNNWGANSTGSTQLFRHLMEDADFKREFTDRCYIYMGDFLNEQGTREVWDPMYEMIRYEYPHHRKLINQWWPNYDNEVSDARKWLQQRTDVFSRQLATFYELGPLVTMSVNRNVKDAHTGDFCFNGIKLSKGTFDGKFPVGRSITLESGPESSLNVTAWRVITDGKVSEYQGRKLELDIPRCNSLIVSALIDNASGIREIQGDTEGVEAVYDLHGRRTGMMNKGINIVRDKNGRTRKVVVQ